jgi:uncharacterized phage protein gp47/JayE
MAKLTQNGLEWDNLGAVLDKMENIANEKFKDLMGADDRISLVGTTAIGALYGVLAEIDSSQEEILFQIYNMFDPDTSEGVYLDRMVWILRDMVREGATPAESLLMLRGEVNVVVPEFSNVFNSKTGDSFRTTSNVTFSPLNSNGIVIDVANLTVDTEYNFGYRNNSSVNTYAPIRIISEENDTPASLLERLNSIVNNTSTVLRSFIDEDDLLHIIFKNESNFGTFTTSPNLRIVQTYQLVNSISNTFTAVIQKAGDLNKIRSSVEGWLDVYNPYDSTESKPIEGDPELRTRFKNSKGLAQKNNREAMYDALYSLSGVRYVNVVENTQDVELEGRISHGIAVTVLGGDEDEIAIVIDKYRAFAGTDGNVTKSFQDYNGTPYDVKFFRPEIVPIEIKIGLTTNPSVFPTDGVLRIQNALIDYFENLPDTRRISWSRLFDPINTVDGQSVNSLEIGVKGFGTGTANIELEYNQIPSLSYEDIHI